MFLKKFSSFVIGGFEKGFFRYGRFVSTHPWWAILGCLVIAGLSGIGLLEYRTENNAFKLWIPDNSEFLKNYNFLQEKFPPDTRFNNFIVAGGNVLTPAVIKLLYKMHDEVTEIATENGRKWEDLCTKIPVVNYTTNEVTRKPNCTGEYAGMDEILCDIPRYCFIADNITSEVCLETGILELWGYDSSKYENLTEEMILEKVNSDEIVSKPFGRPINLESYLKLTRNATTNQIIGATALSMSWIGKVNTTGLTDQDVSDSGSGLPVDKTTAEFEELLRKKLEEFQSQFLKETNSEAFINVARSYEDVAGETILNDAVLMPVGFTIVFIYIMIMLGRFDCVHARAFLSMVGVGSIGLTILVTYGLCSGFGLFFGPMHNVIPFLFLGIGIDDMFVIMQSFDNLKPSEKRAGDNPHNIGMAMKHAGVAITVTSITDVVVFGVGASTTLPSLRSFCLYCAVGMTAVYFFQATFFVACLAIDQRRIDQQRNGFLPCFKHNLKERKEESSENDKSDSDNSLTGKIFKKFGEILVNPLVSIFVIVSTCSILGASIYGVTQLETKFEAEWFLPPDSYLSKWFDASKQYFPSDGVQVTVYMTELNYTGELDRIENLIEDFVNSPDIINSVDAWYPELKTYFNEPEHMNLTDEGYGIPNMTLDEATFNNYTSLFLFSKEGSKFRPNFFTLPSPLECGKSFEKIELTTFAFQHVRFTETSEQISAMNRVKEMIKNQEFSNNVFALAQEYSNWETDEVIDSELYRNLGISMACVFVTTLFLLADILGSVQVMLCVLMTLVDVMGFMHFWGLTIDVVSSIIVIISIGLCVDYSAHIAHTFLTTQGSRKERTVKTVQNIGPAVLNGGFSTFLALALLATSESHVFSSFFKVFFLVITFGLYHGLVFFPVLLSLIGPSAYQHSEDDHQISAKKGHSKQATTL